jgi:hypothetical protein
MIGEKLLLPSSVGRRNTISERPLKVLTRFGKKYQTICISENFNTVFTKARNLMLFEQDVLVYGSLGTKSKIIDSQWVWRGLLNPQPTSKKRDVAP